MSTRLSATVLFRTISSINRTFCTSLPVTVYRSQYSIDNIYKGSNPDFLRPLQIKPTLPNDEQFNGYIPVDQLEIKFSRSSGPGGQNVNKVSTKVQVRFHVQSAQWIPDFAKDKLLKNEHGRITKDGFLIVWSEKTRKQMLNQADCVAKIRSMIWKASILPKEPTAEEIERKDQRIAKAKREIIREKKTKSLKKQTRQGPGMDGV